MQDEKGEYENILLALFDFDIINMANQVINAELRFPYLEPLENNFQNSIKHTEMVRIYNNLKKKLS